MASDANPWFHSRAYDLRYIFGGALFGLALPLLALAGPALLLPTFVWAWLIFFEGSHFYATTARSLLDPDFRRENGAALPWSLWFFALPLAALGLKQSRVDGLHWLTSGGASFVLISCAMVAGSIVGGRKVATMLAEKVTKMDHCEGFTANLTTAALVSVGATMGLPLSTTHVSAGGIIGAGLVRGTLATRTLRDIALAWVVTLPASFAIGAIAAWVTR